MSAQTSATTALQSAQQPDKWSYRDRHGDPDAFAQVFAHTNDAPKNQDKIAPRENNAPEPRDPPARTHCRRHETSAPRNDEQDDRRVSSADEDEQPTETAEARPAQTNEEKPRTCHKAEKKPKTEGECADTANHDSSTPDNQTPQAEAVEGMDTTQIVEGLDIPTDTPADDKPAVAFCLSPALQAQAEASESCGTGDKEDGAQKPASQDGQDSLQNLLSFRADSKTGVAAPGKSSGNDGSLLPGLKEDVMAALAGNTDGGAADETDTALETDINAAAFVGKPDEQTENNLDFTSLMSNLPKSKKEEIKEQNLAVAKGEANSDADNGLTSPPAAGSRVNALMGVSAPTPTGSGGGSPPPAKGVEIQQVSGVGLTQPGSDVSNSASVELTRAPRGAAHLPPSEQVGITVSRMLKAGVTQFEMQLSPAELGKVDIKLEINKDGLVRATVTADNPAAYAALQRDSSSLEKILQQAGLQTNSNSLSFNLREGETQRQQQEANQNTPDWKRWNENADTVDQGEQAQMAFYVATPGRVDVTV